MLSIIWFNSFNSGYENFFLNIFNYFFFNKSFNILLAPDNSNEFSPQINKIFCNFLFLSKTLSSFTDEKEILDINWS